VRKVDHQTYLREMRKRIRKTYSQRGLRRPNKISPGEDLRATVKRHRRSPQTIPDDIQLWLAFYDEAVAFWLVVWATYRVQIRGPSDKRLICLMVLAGRVFQDMICVRELVVEGFFVQSNVVTRSLIEAIDVMHLLNSRPELAERFREIAGNIDSSQFWHEYCSRDKIGRLVKARWLWFFDGDDDAASAFYGMRAGYLDLVGMSAHPSFGACFAAFMDSTQEDVDSIAKNAMGSVSRLSKFTIHLIMSRVFEYGFLWSGPELSLYKTENKTGPASSFEESISKGLSVMLSIMMATEKQVGGAPDPFYPEFGTFWPRENFD
jgi:hypothetical protein